MYRYETQYHDMTVDTGLDPRKIAHYPINEFMQSVAGRNIAGAAWEQLAALQAKGAQAMQRDQDIRAISAATGTPEIALHSSIPQGHEGVATGGGGGGGPPGGGGGGPRASP